MATEHYYDDVGGSMRNSPEAAPLLSPSAQIEVPRDRHHAVFFIFGFLGLASLLPWNFFITAKKYFDYKFRNTSLPADVPFDGKGYTTERQKEFESYISIVSNVSNLFFMIITVLLVRSISVKVRVVVSTLLIAAIFVVTSALVKVDTDSWQNTFFIFTLVMATLMSGVQSVLTGSVLGLSAVFPSVYPQIAMIGQAAGGTFSAIVSILTHAAAGDPTTSGLIYFLIATAITILSLISYICLHYLTFSQYYMLSQEKSGKNVNKINEEVSTRHDAVNRKHFFHSIIKETWMFCLSVCLVFMVTLAVFPAVCANIKSTGHGAEEWKKTYFTPVICFLLFNVGDFAGRLATFICKFPGPQRPGLLLLFCMLRIGFIPLLMLCNAQPRRHLPVVLKNDAWPGILITTMGLSNGYLGTLCMSFGPIRVIDEHLEGAGIILALAMTTGLAGGSGFSFLLINLI